METIRKSIFMLILLLPGTGFGGTDCKIADHPDHYEIVCFGDEKPGAVQSPAVVQGQANITGPTTEKTQPTATAPATSEKTPVVVRTSRRPKQADLDAAKAARNKLIWEERQKEPAATFVPGTVLE